MITQSRDAESAGSIPLSEYAQRRARLLKSLNGGVGVVFAGEGAAPLLGKWRADASFTYLTGITSEAGAAVVFDPTADDPDRRCVLILRPLNPEIERWDGYREQISSTLKQSTGFKTVMRSNVLPRLLTGAARRSKRLSCLHPFTVYPGPVSPDLAVFRSVSERIPGVAIEDRTDLLPQMRAIKSDSELKLMRKAADATRVGYEAALTALVPGVTENQIARSLERGYLDSGAEGVAYNSIVGSGLNATVLHYMDNSGVAQDGELLLIDAGASFEGYACDVTRTFPVNGKFTAEQREVYEVVLRAQLAAIKRSKVGVKMTDVDAAAREVIEKAGLGDAFIHSIGHQLGIEVHDVTPDGPLKAGMVITIEPGVYLPDRKIGVRIEDDILITTKGNQNLTTAIPKTVMEIEAAMAAARASR